MPGRVSLESPARWLHGLVFAAGLSALAVSCRGRTEQTIQDSDGRSFLSLCSSDRICALSQMAGPGATGAMEAKAAKAKSSQVIKLRTTGRLVGVCGPVPTGTEPSISDCRPVVCEGDSNCPASEGLDQGVCINGLCTEPSHPINSDDSVMLCLAGTGVGARSAEQIERLALGLNCGTPCRIPKPCRQP